MSDDPQSGAASGDLDCFTESVPDGYGKLLTRPLGVEGDINDIRAPNSTVLEWYYQLAARWVPKLDCSEYPQTTDDDETDTDIADVSAAATPLAVTTAPPQEAHNKKKKKSNKKEKLPSAMYPRPKAMSFHNFAGPGFVDKTQSSLVFTHRVRKILCEIPTIVGLFVVHFMPAPTHIWKLHSSYFPPHHFHSFCVSM